MLEIDQINQNPPWLQKLKYIGAVLLVLLSLLYALPNIFPYRDAIQVQVSPMHLSKGLTPDVVDYILTASQHTPMQYRVAKDKQKLSIVYSDAQARNQAQKAIGDRMGDRVSLTEVRERFLPKWLSAFGAKPMRFGLDLQGGIYLLMEIDMHQHFVKDIAFVRSAVQVMLPEEKIFFERLDEVIDREAKHYGINVRFSNEQNAKDAIDLLRNSYYKMHWKLRKIDSQWELKGAWRKEAMTSERLEVLLQNSITLRNRIDALGIAEPIVQIQGDNRIAIQIPGANDTEQAKQIIGSTANLEFRLESTAGESSERFAFRNDPARMADLSGQIIVTGAQVRQANAELDEYQRPQVLISLDGPAGRRMADVTSQSIGRRMGIVYVESDQRFSPPEVKSEIISLATIQSQLGNQFVITGLRDLKEAAKLSLLLRAGTLAAPMYFVEERLVGPTLGKENVKSGIQAIVLGLVSVFVLMFLLYGLVGLVANIMLLVNLIILVAFLGIFGANLTLPGIAGMILTVGIAVDANVLVFSRFRESLKIKQNYLLAMQRGYDDSWRSILDANATTFIVGIILFTVGVGTVRGFALTLSMGILISLFTSVFLSRLIMVWLLDRFPPAKNAWFWLGFFLKSKKA